MIFDKIKKYFNEKQKQFELNGKAEDLHRLYRSFSIEELHGDTYIMCNGVAVRKIDPKMTCKQAVDLLNECRDTARAHYQTEYK